MSLRNDIDMVKEELSSEEKFFEKAVVTERFVKKYKNVIIGSVVAIVVVVTANIAYDMNKASQIKAANETLALLMNDSNDTLNAARLATLSPALYDVWSYSKAVADKDLKSLEELQNSKTLIVGDLAKYEIAQSSKDLTKLDAYASKQNAVYADLAIIQSAVLLMSEGKSDVAHQKLTTISEESSLHKVAKALLHYGVK
ncbi:MAG: hypothetical protein PHH41_04940 [Sulfurimonas sp.]|nr:hypothetical protein [Sulfurimonas sp.]MDD5202469.1 hypothetical protein [Sulfurimonas sp.]